MASDSESPSTAAQPSTTQVTIVHTSPACSPGTLEWPSWQHLTATGAATLVSTADQAADQAWKLALENAGVLVTVREFSTVDEWADEVATVHGKPDPTPVESTWFVRYPASSGFDSVLGQATAMAVDSAPLRFLGPQVPLAGEELLDLVYVLDRIVGPEGCSWAQEQTHDSLAPYALEEVCELLDAIDSGNTDHIGEELGDVLLQVVFHCAAAQRISPGSEISIDRVAARIADKMRRRRPHVFAPGGHESGVEQARLAWAAAKAAEKAERESCVEGVAVSMPSLARAAKILDRVAKEGLLDEAWRVWQEAESNPGSHSGAAAGSGGSLDDRERVGRRLLDQVHEQRLNGIDGERALRAALTRFTDIVRTVERAHGLS